MTSYREYRELVNANLNLRMERLLNPKELEERVAQLVDDRVDERIAQALADLGVDTEQNDES